MEWRGSTGDAGTDVSLRMTETEPTVVTPSDGSGMEGFKWSGARRSGARRMCLVLHGSAKQLRGSQQGNHDARGGQS